MSEEREDAFAAVLAEAAPPPNWSAPLAALWWVGTASRAADPTAWARAHALVQDDAGPDAAWVHAHLHRVEGDDGNARYWYARAGREPAEGPLAGERAAIAAALLRPR